LVVLRPSAAAAFAADCGDAVSRADAARGLDAGWKFGCAINVAGAISSAAILIAIIHLAEA
jgi:hypothetical protein